jgi:ABC-2 type transport system ATP-binding protein
MDRRSVIMTENLTRRFGETVAVDGLTLAVERGEILGFLGHNGAGKTTTVRLLNGVLAPNGGSISVLGLDPLRDGVALRRRTGVLTETPSLDERLTARENLALYAELYGVGPADAPRRVLALLETFELAERADDRVGGYSRGMKQRLAIARALLHEPELLFLDEPTSGLDPVATRQMHDLIRAFAGQGERTVFLCTHNLAEAQRLCDRVCVMEQGRLVAVGAPRELAQALTTQLRLDLEVAPEHLALAREQLGRLPQVRAVERGENGAALTVTVAQREAIPALNAALVQAGVAVYRLVPHEATLEDVYFSLHRDGARQNRSEVTA